MTLNVSISGVNAMVISSNHVVRIKLQSRLNSYTAAIECIVTDQVTDKISAVSSRWDKFNFPRNIRLADPRFHISSDIELLIEVELFWNLIWSNQVFRQIPNSPENTIGLDFGGSFRQHHIDRFKDSLVWRVSVTNAELTCQSCLQMDDISAQSDNYTMEENMCERHFLDNVSQNSQDRYTIKLPVR